MTVCDLVVLGGDTNAVETCVEQVILAPTDPTDTTGLFETAVTGRDKFSNLGGFGNEVNISSLLQTIQETNNLNCLCEDISPEGLVQCTHQECTKTVLKNYISLYVSDLDGNGRLNCDAAAILLYVGHKATRQPTSIRCSFFWSIYRRNVGFLKQSTGLDINKIEIAEPKAHIVKESKKSLRQLDSELFVCRNGQCKFKAYGSGIVRCDGHVDCADHSDEENCDFCPETSVKCLISGTPTCLPKNEICLFSPEKCWHSNNTELSLKMCVFDKAEEKFIECKNYLDKYFKTKFGVQRPSGFNVTVPNQSYRNGMCRGNDLGTDIDMNLEEALQILPASIIDFKYLNYKQALCQEKVKMAIILPRGQWYAPSAVINDAWYCMVLQGIALCCMVWHGFAW